MSVPVFCPFLNLIVRVFDFRGNAPKHEAEASCRPQVLHGITSARFYWSEQVTGQPRCQGELNILVVGFPKIRPPLEPSTVNRGRLPPYSRASRPGSLDADAEKRLPVVAPTQQEEGPCYPNRMPAHLLGGTEIQSQNSLCKGVWEI